MVARKGKQTKRTPPKVVLEFNVLDQATKKRIMRCIERRGKVRITMQHKGKAKALGHAGFAQQID